MFSTNENEIFVINNLKFVPKFKLADEIQIANNNLSLINSNKLNNFLLKT